MEFSCCILPPRQPREMRAFARLAEELGFDRFWVSDQTFHSDPFVMLLELARYVRLPLGLALTNPFTRHPAQIARAIATVRHLAPRPDWAFALGAANPRHVLAPLGMPLRNAATQTGTALSVVRDLLAGNEVNCIDSRLDYRLEGIRLEIEPVTDVGLYLGTRGPRMLREGGARADGVIVEALFAPEAVEWARGEIRTGRAESTLPGEPRYVAWQVTEVLAPGEAVPGHAAAFAKHLMSTTHDSVLARVGFSPELIATVKADGAVADVPDWAVRRFAAVDTAEHLQAAVLAAQRAGAGAWSCSFSGSAEETAAGMKRFATEVIAPLRIEGMCMPA